MKFIVVDDNERETNFEVKKEEIVLKVIENRINLFIPTDKGNLFYEIHADDREPDINKIKEFLNKAFNSNFKISEYFARCYILITTETEIRQFTAHKLL